MAVKTKAQILSEISSLLADNTTGDISAQDVRTVVNDITDSYENLITAGTTSQYWRGDKTWQTLPLPTYKTYSAKLYQTGTGDISATILQNTFGFNITFNRSSAGIYIANDLDLQDYSDAIILISGFDYKGPDYVIIGIWDAENKQIIINTYNSGTLSDGVLGDDDLFYLPSIEIHLFE